MQIENEVRCPIHGFIGFDDWEKEIIDHPVFQRLRRIRQLGWTEYVYPGAVHTRFEHSLGVMHLATRLFDAVWENSGEMLKSEFKFSDEDRVRQRKIVRLSALLHDVGHGPFSHVSEDVMPTDKDGNKIKHEAYSVEAVRTLFTDVIDGSLLRHADITAEEVANFLEGGTEVGSLSFWRDLVDSQMDADRMDYLLRDSFHCGVAYGRYDIDRLVNTVCAIPEGDGTSPRIGFTEGGAHAAEGLILARYSMFTQVYFHKTRVIYDHIVGEMMKDSILPSGVFPTPDNLEDYLRWDDWRVLGQIISGGAGEFGQRLVQRNHFRQIWKTPEVMESSHRRDLNKAKSVLGDLLMYCAEGATRWYKYGRPDIWIHDEDTDKVSGLAELSRPVHEIRNYDMVRLYVKPEDFEAAKEILAKEKL